MGRLCVQAKPPDLARREAGGGRGRHAPEAAGRQTRTRAAADGSDTVRPASLAGPVRPALVSIRRVGLGEGRSSPWSWGVQRGGFLNPPSCITTRMLSVPFYRRLRGITDILLEVNDAIRFTEALHAPVNRRALARQHRPAQRAALRGHQPRPAQDGRDHDRARILGVDVQRPLARGRGRVRPSRWPSSSRPRPHYRWPPRNA